ncbi:T9SS type A sorting domain-containing protein [Foetidibacter luteolus]|uniref:T9SS type A sorting domain-containing protein n=1 Tax=Foetidibacter luteolus TaxID=2608880 RepID=UPI00129B7F1E|nr:T9SS type A sorting domain-containing protein [Foetidibacter luteolus]
MKIKLLLSLLLLSSFATAQNKRAFAVTGETKGSFNWTVIREIDLASGAVLRNIYVPSVTKANAYDAASGKAISDDYTPTTSIVNNGQQTVSRHMVAAAAYDAKNNRLFFTPMQSAELRYIDLNSAEPKVFCIKTQALKQFVSKAGEEDVITRMAFASDGFGYALTNNGRHLIRFSSGKKVVIQDLGALKDGAANGKISVHTPTSSWGGDMIADAFGNLYLISVKGHVFKINTGKKVADYVGLIKSLPNDFSVNGAAVDDDNNFIVSSAVNTSAYYRVNLGTLQATAVITGNQVVFNASDLANEKFAFESLAGTKTNLLPVSLRSNRAITVLPNPVVNRAVTVYFNGELKGRHDITLVDMQGRNLMVKNVNLQGKQTERLNLSSSFLPGMYMIKVSGGEGKKVFAERLVVAD